MVVGIVSFIIGLVSAMSTGEVVAVALGFAILLLCLWLAAITFVVTGMARNMFKTASRVHAMGLPDDRDKP